MTTETLEQPANKLELVKAQDAINNGLIAFNDKKAELELLAESSKGLTIAGVDDKVGFKSVTEARKKLKAERVQIEKDGKLMRDQLTFVSRNISAKEKELIKIIEPIEDELQAEEKRIEAIKEKLRAEEEARETARIQARIDTLAGYGYELDYSDIKSMSDAAFDTLAQTAKSEWEREEKEKADKEAERIAQEARDIAAREAEAERMRKERQELELLREEQQKAQAKIDEQNAAIAAERAKMEAEKLATEQKKKAEDDRLAREAELVKARAEAAEAARLKAIEDARAAEEKKKADAEKARVAAEKKAARQPDKVKIQAYVSAIKFIQVPELKTDEAVKVMAVITDLVDKLENYAVKQIETL